MFPSPRVRGADEKLTPPVIARRPKADEAIQKERERTLATGVIWIASLRSQ